MSTAQVGEKCNCFRQHQAGNAVEEQSVTMFPLKTFHMRRRFDKTAIADPYAETRREMDAISLEGVQQGQSVAITASSRGITDIVPITKAVVDHFTEIGLRPVIVPAMGSHAGGTAASQEQLLRDAGLTGDCLNCPIHSSMETVVLGELDVGDGISCLVHFDRIAAEADHVFLVNRIKSHTRFAGPIESGLLKMLMIGLGNAVGASIYHRAVADDRFSAVIRRVAGFIMSKRSVLGGVGIVENAEGQTATVRAIAAGNLFDEEEKLLALSKRLMPRLPFDEIDLLFIDRIGKNISGTGFDTNVVGRKFNDHRAVRGEKPVVRRIAVLGLTPETHGNATGLGIAEFCLTSLLKGIDVTATRLNAITADHVSAAMIPLDYETEEEIIAAAWHSLGSPEPSDFRVLWIQDTQHLEEMVASEALLKNLPSGIEVLGECKR